MLMTVPELVCMKRVMEKIMENPTSRHALTLISLIRIATVHLPWRTNGPSRSNLYLNSETILKDKGSAWSSFLLWSLTCFVADTAEES